MSSRVCAREGFVSAEGDDAGGGARLRCAQSELQRRLPAVIRRLAPWAVAAVSVACVPAYRPPSMNEPHAIVKFRRSYEQVAGTGLRETIEISEHRAYSDSSAAQMAAAPRTDALLVHPVASELRVATGFFHTEQRTERES